MRFANSAVDLLRSIDQWQPLRSDWSSAPLVRKNKEPLRSEGVSQILSASVTGLLCRTKIRH
jgi:hypothetical protein